MKLVSTPYRWRWRTWYKNLNHWYWDIRTGIRNVYRFFPEVWWHRSFDSDGMLAFIEKSATLLEKTIENGHLANGERYAKQLMQVRVLCRRLRADDYFRNAGYDPYIWESIPGYRATQIAQHSHYMAKQDAERLGKMFKFVQHWWD